MQKRNFPQITLICTDNNVCSAKICEISGKKKKCREIEHFNLSFINIFPVVIIAIYSAKYFRYSMITAFHVLKI